jgi:hypothetical protein
MGKKATPNRPLDELEFILDAHRGWKRSTSLLNRAGLLSSAALTQQQSTQQQPKKQRECANTDHVLTRKLAVGHLVGNALPQLKITLKLARRAFCSSLVFIHTDLQY